MRLLAISDLHVGLAKNRAFVETITDHRDDWLAIAGDVGETSANLRFVLDRLRPKFAKMLWTPGNHELWALEDPYRGEERYGHLVKLCREYDVLTPEDAYVHWPSETSRPLVVAPLFLLYDYSFRPDDVARADALAWAEETGVVCTDEALLDPQPYPTRDAWCEARCATTAARLAALPAGTDTILVNHYPLRRAHAWLPRIPRFSLWCGTTRTEDWHLRFRARAVVYGHLHIRQRRIEDGVTFHEVSLGYPPQWTPRDPDTYLRQIWPPEDATS